MATLWRISRVEPTLSPLYDCEHIRYVLVYTLTRKNSLVHVKLWLTSVPRFFFGPFLWRRLIPSASRGLQKQSKDSESLFMNLGLH